MLITCSVPYNTTSSFKLYIFTYFKKVLLCFYLLQMSLMFKLVRRRHLVWLCRLMENTGVDGCCNQVIGCCDGVNVSSQMEVELKWSTKGLDSFQVAFLSTLPSITPHLWRGNFVPWLRGPVNLLQNIALMTLSWHVLGLWSLLYSRSN